METLIAVGLVIQFLYPKHNYRGVRQDFDLRRIRIEAVRTLVETPLDPFTLANDPLKNRGSRLITGYDFDRMAERSFYWESMREVKQIEEPTYGDDSVPPERRAIIQIDRSQVVARGLHSSEAAAFAEQWSRRHGRTEIVPESVNWPSDDQVLSRWRQAQ